GQGGESVRQGVPPARRQLEDPELRRRAAMRAIFRVLGVGSVLALLLLGVSAEAQMGPSQNLKDWFQRHDKNRDGKLDHEEFHQAVVESFYFRDKNNRGYLTIEELQGASPEAVKAASRTHDTRLSLDQY